MVRRRLDRELVRRGLARTPEEARAAVSGGRVRIGGMPADKASTLVAPGVSLDLAPDPRRFASRGGDKLRAALERFSIDPAGRECLDAGASTGGFTDCLLQLGAARVAAVDVGYGQLAWQLRTDPRVAVFERTNVRDLEPEDLPFVPTIVVADVSFVSLRLILPSLARLAGPAADLVTLVKPQFEAPGSDVGPGGVVRDPVVWRRCLDRVIETSRRNDLAPVSAAPSPLLGPAGNVEFFLHASRGRPPRELDLDPVVNEAMEMVSVG